MILTTEDDLQTTEDDLDMLEVFFCFLQINKNTSLSPFKYSEMILNYEGKMIDEVNRMEGDLQTTEDYLQTTEDDLQTTEDDEGMMEDDQNFHLQTNKAILNPFECSEMMGTSIN